jgi:hypothetical protein
VTRTNPGAESVAHRRRKNSRLGSGQRQRQPAKGMLVLLLLHLPSHVLGRTLCLEGVHLHTTSSGQLLLRLLEWVPPKCLPMGKVMDIFMDRMLASMHAGRL